MQTLSTASQTEFFLCSQVLLTKVCGLGFQIIQLVDIQNFQATPLVLCSFQNKLVKNTQKKKNTHNFTAGIPSNQMSVNNVTFSFKILTNSDKKPKILEF
eukprot:TRINITY_DN11774_c0_g2_i10.p3 TRINITY_DN11774_c0_g2~~TRINITY_DN11774_c0_g2_i10.p3  ORF type:complete len:100 (-),score=5.49 TRINITY_DN11774_c0_g2_i10:100-399(-)